MDLDDLRFFVRLAEAGSLSEAGRRLHSSPPAMSRRLAALEDRLGVRLVTRSSRHFALTGEGLLLQERALVIVAAMDETETELRGQRATPAGALRIGAPMELGRRRVAPLLAVFTQRYPKVTCELVLSDEGQDPVRDELDLVLRTTAPAEAGVIRVPVLHSRRIVCAAPVYVERFGWPETPEQLAGHRCLVLVRGRRMFDRWRFASDAGTREVQVPAALSSTSGEVIHDWAMAGEGIALKAQWDVQGDLEAGRLLEGLSGFSTGPMRLYLVFAARDHMATRISALIEFLREGLR